MSRHPSPLLLSYHAATELFRAGEDTPRDFLERSIERLEAVEGTTRAFAALSIERARVAADAATQRWREGRPLSPIDGMPIGIKDVIETFDMPTGLGSPTSERYRAPRDAACVFALREAGAAIVGKTKTTEFASTFPTDTRHPLEPSRTPGGSSSGSAAAVGGGVLPAALGTQVIGSVLRPAAYCGAFGFKPTFGAINRGGSHDFQSQSCIGAIGASLADLWHTVFGIALRAGGDPGHPGLFGDAEPPKPSRPSRLIVLRMPDWETVPADVNRQFESLLSACSAAGVQLLTGAAHAGVAAFEQAALDMQALSFELVGYESLWPLKTAAYHDAWGLTQRMHDRIAQSSALGREGYRALLNRRAALRAQFEALVADTDGIITLTTPCAAPIGLSNTGNSKFTVQASLLGAPAITVPMLEDGGMPVGLQLIGGQHRDEALFRTAGWIAGL
ncbi:Glutamyl-tRNA(Gln) amidotransferase subunit A [Pigmentiphaga humi]|uniref:Glutamyl-tRNA(Gln) amidotransferase subunit A n=1 Tax=Pigmentiphaga humi TaxID=2478468 RepID=A0A3P4B6I7_9BURK|nr:amidase [Pigmentiphaga humi]VCU71692.1 Glutamyl-tRNA(Gln) amidotransferase subunit A [Pigmentiphaga humi]